MTVRQPNEDGIDFTVTAPRGSRPRHPARGRAVPSLGTLKAFALLSASCPVISGHVLPVRQPTSLRLANTGPFDSGGALSAAPPEGWLVPSDRSPETTTANVVDPFTAGADLTTALGAVAHSLALPSSAKPAVVSIISPPALTPLSNPALAVQDLTCPGVAGVERFSVQRRPSRIVVTFFGSVDPVRARNPASYALVGPGLDGLFGTQDDEPIRVTAAAFDPATNRVTLAPGRRLNVHDRVLFTIKAGVFGRPIGDDFVTLIGGGQGLGGPPGGHLRHAFAVRGGRIVGRTPVG